MVAIFVALMFVGLVLVDVILQRIEARRVAAASYAVTAPMSRPAGMGIVSGFPGRIPRGVYLSEDHTWFKPDPAGGVQVGADALVAHAVGAADRVLLPRVGDQVTAGQPLFHLMRDDRVLTILSSITGKVVAVNDCLQEHPELLAGEPYGAGWVCAVTPSRLEEPSRSMRFGEKAAAWLETEFDRFCEFVSARMSPDLAVGVTSQDGGLRAAGPLTQVDHVAWSAFEREFLRSR